MDAYSKLISARYSLFHDIKDMVPHLDHRITDIKHLTRRIADILMEFDDSEVLHMKENSEYLNAKVEETVPIAREHQQMFKERLFPPIKFMFPDQVQQITGMLLDLPGSELLHILERGRSRDAVKENVHYFVWTRLVPVIQSMFQDLDHKEVVKITDRLLDRCHNSELLLMLENRESLKAKVDEVVAVLDQTAHQVCTVQYQGDVKYL